MYVLYRYIMYYNDCRWRIICHGCIDGYSRRIIYLKACNNNRDDTVLQLFTESVEHLGLPCRVRGDRGGENIGVANYMLRESWSRTGFIAGRFVHNQQIERLWRDLFLSCTCLFYQLFYFMEANGNLDIDNEIHIFCLHYVFIPRVNASLCHFIEAWNNHTIPGEYEV